jgi:hypothetical protein
VLWGVQRKHTSQKRPTVVDTYVRQSPKVWKNLFGVYTVSRDRFTFCATTFIQPLVLLSALLLVTSRCACAAHLSRAFYCQFNARFKRLGGLEVGGEDSILIQDRIIRTYKAKAQKHSHAFREQHPELLGSNSRVKRAVLCYCHDGKE